MTTLEDRVRAATRDRASEITRASIPPLRLAPPASRSAQGAGRRLLRRLGSALPAELGGSGPSGVALDRSPWQRRLIPLAAAVAVIAVVMGVTAVVTHSATRTGSERATPLGQLGPAPRWVSLAIPRYYLALAGSPGDPEHAAIYSSVTGARLARVVPPKPFGTFVNVSAAADDRTFVLTAQTLAQASLNDSQGVAFFVLRFSPSRDSTRLTPLTGLTEPANAMLDAFALSPDGRQLAVAFEPSGRGGASEVVQTLSLSTGTLTSWSTDDGVLAGDTADPLEMSWTADGKTLAFNWLGSGPPDSSHPTAQQQAESGLRLLDLSSPSRDLIAASRLALPIRGQNRTTPAGSQSDVAVITPDGQTVLASVNGRIHRPGTLAGWFNTGFAEFSAATGALRQVRDWRHTSSAESGPPPDVLWTSPSGKILVVCSPAGHWNRIGVLRGSQLTLLPQLPEVQVPAAAW